MLMHDERPGMDHRRLIRIMKAAIERCQLDLSGATILTEAASGAYVTTPVLAAMAGAAQVFAVTSDTRSRFGTVADVTCETMALANRAGVRQRIEVLSRKTPAALAAADIVTNSGHVRPIDAPAVACMKSAAVIALMYEAWEFRAGDIDLDACRRRGIRVGGVNERHPAVDVFSFLGALAIRLLHDAAIAVYQSRILLLCDNPFAPFIERGLVGAGARVDARDGLAAVEIGRRYDAILVALRPRSAPVLSGTDAGLIARRWPDVVIAQFWGDVDRAGFASLNVPVWPPQAPSPGHMGIFLSALGPEPVIRLQTGGLKAAEVLFRNPYQLSRAQSEFVQVVGTEDVYGG